MIQGRWACNLVASSLAFVIHQQSAISNNDQMALTFHGKNTLLMYKITTHASHYTIPRTIGTINSLQKVFVYSRAWFTVNHTPEKRREKKIHNSYFI